MKISFITLVVIFSAASCCSGSRILVFQAYPSVSRYNVISAVANELGRRGHQVVYYTPMSEPKPQPNVAYVKINCNMSLLKGGGGNLGSLLGTTSAISMVMFGQSVMAPFTEDVMKSDAVQRLMHSSDEKFDAIIHESFFANEMAAYLAHRFSALSIPVLGMGDDFWTNEHSGHPDNPSYMVSWLSRSTDRMNFVQRLLNAFSLSATTLLKYYYLNRVEASAKRHFNYTGWESRPPLSRLLSDNALILVNSHHSIGFNYPKAPHVKEIGGVHVQPPSPLPKDIAQFLDESSDGFILFSLGSVIGGHLVSEKVKETLVKALSSVHLRILCKFPDETIKMPENIKVAKWIPQNDVLAHKNIKLFISHGGLQSTIEAIHHGVPMLLIPFFTDQFKNSKIVERAGFGISVDTSTIDHSSITSAINELISNPKYKEKAAKQSLLLKDRLMHPLDESIYWIEYVLKHGKVLQPYSVHMSFIQLHQLDILVTLLLACIACYYALKHTVHFARNLWRSKPFKRGRQQSKKNQ